MEVDEETYKEVCALVEQHNIEAAEYLMMMRSKSPLMKSRIAVEELYYEMRGGW